MRVSEFQLVGLVRCVTVGACLCFSWLAWFVVCPLVRVCARVGWLGSLGDRWCVSVLQLVGLVRCVTVCACL